MNRFLKRQNSSPIPNYFTKSELTLDSLRSILSVPPKDRPASDTAILVYFTQYIKVFAELIAAGHAEAHSQCCKYLLYEQYAKGDFVFNAGEEGSKFYVIISGSCAVLAPVSKPNGVTEYSQLALLRQGECFGELALLTYKPRAASVLCREDTHLAVLERNDYLRVLGKTHAGAMQSKLNLLMQIPIFGNWSKTALQSLSYFFKDRGYKRHQTLFRSGQPVKEVYIVMRGEFQLCKHICQGSARVMVDVTVLTTGELVGAEELMKGLPYRYTCVCRSTQGDVLHIAREDFLGRVTNEDTVGYLRKMNETKEEYRTARVLKLTQLVQKQKTALLRSNPQEKDRNAVGNLVRDALVREKTNLRKLPGVPLLFTEINEEESQTERPPLRPPSPTGSPKPQYLSPRTTWLRILKHKYPLHPKNHGPASVRLPLVTNIHTHHLRTQSLQLLYALGKPASKVTSPVLSRINISFTDD